MNPSIPSWPMLCTSKHSLIETRFAQCSSRSRDSAPPRLFFNLTVFVPYALAMSDPFSVAGSAVGVVSLGLTVCQGLVEYYEAWRSQDDELSNFLQDCNDLTSTLTQLWNFLERPSSSPSNVVEHVTALVKRLSNRILQLQKILEQCRQTSLPQGISQKLGHTARRALYPFKRATIRSLREAIDDARQTLTAGVQVLQLYVSLQGMNDRGTNIGIATFPGTCQRSRSRWPCSLKTVIWLAKR